MNTLRCAHEARNMCEPMSSFGPDARARARARVERGGQAASWGPLRGPHQVEKIRSIRPRVLYYIYIERRGISRGLRFLSTSSIELVRVRPCYYCARSVYLSLFLSFSLSFWLPDSCFFVSHRELFEVRFGEVLRGIVKLLENCR